MLSSHSLEDSPGIVLAAPLCWAVVPAHGLPGEAVSLYFGSQDADSSSDVCFWVKQFNGVNAPFFDPIVVDLHDADIIGNTCALGTSHKMHCILVGLGHVVDASDV